MTWWTDPATIERFVLDLVAAEVARLRPDQAAPSLDRASALDATGIGLDSLELLTLATAVAETTQLGRSGLEDYLLARRTVGDWIAIVRQGLERYSDSLIFRTSGSTGTPKPCPHRLGDLGREIDALAGIVGQPGRVLGAVPSHHIYGFLFTVLLPARLAVPLIDIRATGPWGVGKISQARDLIVGHPAYWDMVARASAALEPVTVVSSAGRLDPATGAALRRLGASRVIEIYGSTETAGIGWREPPNPTFELFRHWARTGDGLVGPAGLIGPPDRLDWEGAGRFRVVGRFDGAVKIGGITVDPELIRRHLASHPRVRAAAIRPERIGDTIRLKAFIVPTDDRDLERLDADLRSFIDRSLTPPERPRAVRYGPRLPMDAMGKVADWG